MHIGHHTTKFFHTLRVCAGIIMARTFGTYLHSGWDGDRDFCIYEWRGRKYYIPTISRVYEC